MWIVVVEQDDEGDHYYGPFATQEEAKQWAFKAEATECNDYTIHELNPV